MSNGIYEYLGRAIVACVVFGCSDASTGTLEVPDASSPESSGDECPDAATEETVEYMGREIPVLRTRRGCAVTIDYSIL